jgi:multidrug efflux pump subunit AcrA (membrane-fusion protein)
MSDHEQVSMSSSQGSAVVAAPGTATAPSSAGAASGASRKWIWTSLGVLLVLAGIGSGGYYVLAASGSGGLGDLGPTAPVVRGPLVVKVVESGEIKAAKETTIRNDLRWPAVILEVVENGTLVEPNDVLIRFECNELLEAKEKKELAVADANNDFTSAEQNLALRRDEMASKLRKAENALIDANKALERYVEGEYDIKLQEYHTDIDIARRNLAVAKDQLEVKLKVNEDPELKGLYSEKVIEAARFEVSKQEAALEKAQMRLAMFKEFDHPKTLRQLRTGVDDAELGFKRARMEADREIIKAESHLAARKSRLEMLQEQLDEMIEDEKDLIVRAEKRGLVVYDTGRRRWQPDTEIAEGEKIQPRQQLMVIPDMTTLEVRTQVFESLYKLAQPGVEAIIRLDVEPDSNYPGEISEVAPLAGRAHWFNPGVKVYRVKVQFDEVPAGLKPNMTAKVEMILDRKDNVLHVPIAAVFTEQDKTYVWREAGSGPEQVIVKIGQSNEERVEILTGLDEGDQVYLAPPDVSSTDGAGGKPNVPGTDPGGDAT